jgi:hypothetical protein
MITRRYLAPIGPAGAFVGVVLAGMLLYSTRGHADDGVGDNESRIRQGFAIAPVVLNLHGKNPALVGLGSYLVNAVSGCNACHTLPPFKLNGNPFLRQPEMINVDGYLGGGTPIPAPEGGVVISRNLTPDKSGMPEGHTFQDFLLIMRTGTDLDARDPTRAPPLQVMPWPYFQNMSDNDLRAIYEYLSAIPCVEGGPNEPLHRCP